MTRNKLLAASFLVAVLALIKYRGGFSGVGGQHDDLPSGWKWHQYHHHDEVVSFLGWLQQAYAGIVDVHSIGHSTQNRELLVARLSGARGFSQLDTKPPRVQVKLVGGIHGNEQACPELLLRLMQHLASKYGHSPRITALLDRTDIHVLPVMNPDGREADTRLNAQGTDLNRNFPLGSLPFGEPSMQVTPGPNLDSGSQAELAWRRTRIRHHLPTELIACNSWHSTGCMELAVLFVVRSIADAPGPPSDSDSDTVKSWRKDGSGPPQPEVSAVMKWSKAHNFRLSASLHQGALVANYPFDSCDTQGRVRQCPTPDDPLPLFLATAYATNHPAMRLNNNDSFMHGTVQGAQWYTLLGGMQDWVYWDRNSLELTLELNPVMKPPAEEVAGLMWRHNLPALLRLIELAHFGLQARLLDAHTSKPLTGHVEVLAPSRHRVVNITGATGSFSMMLAPDTVYCLVLHPRSPDNKHHMYRTIKVAILRAGGRALMRATGLKGLTQQADFLAVRHHGLQAGGHLDPGAVSSMAPVKVQVPLQVAAGTTPIRQSHSSHWWGLDMVVASRRLLHRPVKSQARGARAVDNAGDVVLLGQASPDMCWFDGSS